MEKINIKNKTESGGGDRVRWENFNPLPSRTWRWLGVNGGPVEFPLPKLTKYGGKPFAGQAPEGAEIEETAAAAGPVGSDADPALPPQAAEFVRRHRNAGYFVRQKAGVGQGEPIVFDYRVGAENPGVVDDNLIVAEPGSKVTVVMHYTSGPGARGLHCGLTRLVAKAGAKIRLIQIQTLSNGCDHFDIVGGDAQQDGRIEVIQVELGGGRSYTGCKARLTGDRSRFEADTLYLGDGGRKLDINLLCEHYGKKTGCTMDAHGALLDHSDKIFRGTIDFKKGSSGSKGREQENTMLLGPHVRSRTSPLILCAEEDVDGHHAASAGRVNGDRMFYLMSRGLSESQAKKLMIEAEFAPVTDKIKVPAFRREISDFLKERLDQVE